MTTSIMTSLTYHVKEKVLADTSAHINKASVFAELNSLLNKTLAHVLGIPPPNLKVCEFGNSAADFL